MIPKNTICLWFDKDAEAAARFYAATFPDSKVTAVHKAPADYPSGKAGDVLTVISRSTTDLQPVLDTIVTTAARLCKAEQGLIFRIDEGKYRVVAASNAHSDFIAFMQGHDFSPDRRTSGAWNRHAGATPMTADILTRAADRPLPTAFLLARVVLPWALAVYIVYILMWYLPFKFYPDSYLFQVLEDSLGLPWFEPYFRYFTGGVEAVTCLLLVIPGLQVAGAVMAWPSLPGARPVAPGSRPGRTRPVRP